MNCVGQSSKDTLINLPAKVARALYIDAKQKDILLQEVSILNQRITEKETIIAALKSTDSLNTKIISTYEQEIKAMKDQRGIYDGLIKVLEKQIRKERRKRFWTTMLGITTTAAATYLYITK